MNVETLNAFSIDMARDKEERFKLNGNPIDASEIQTMDIHIEGGEVQIRTTTLKNMKLGM